MFPAHIYVDVRPKLSTGAFYGVATYDLYNQTKEEQNIPFSQTWISCPDTTTAEGGTGLGLVVI